MAFNNPFAAPNPYPAYLCLMLLVVVIVMVVWLQYSVHQLLDTVAVQRRNSNARGASGRIESKESDHDNQGFRNELEEIYYAGDHRFDFDGYWAQLDRCQERLDRHRRELLDLQQQVAGHDQSLVGYLGRLHVLDRIQEAFEESLDAHDRHLDLLGDRLNELYRRQRDTARQIRTLQDEAGELRLRVAALEAQRSQGHVAYPRNGFPNIGQPVQGPHPCLQQRPRAAQGGSGNDLSSLHPLHYDQQAAQRPRDGLNLGHWIPPQPTKITFARPYAHDEPHFTVARHELNQPRRPASESNGNRDIHPTQEDQNLERFRRVRQIIRERGHQRVAESLARLQQAAEEAYQIPVAQDLTSGTHHSSGSAENATTDEDQSQQQRRDGHPQVENASNLTIDGQVTASHPSDLTAEARSQPPSARNVHGAYVESADEESAGDGARNTATEHARVATDEPRDEANGLRGSSSTSGSIPIVLDLRYEGARERQE